MSRERDLDICETQHRRVSTLSRGVSVVTSRVNYEAVAGPLCDVCNVCVSATLREIRSDFPSRVCEVPTLVFVMDLHLGQ